VPKARKVQLARLAPWVHKVRKDCKVLRGKMARWEQPARKARKVCKARRARLVRWVRKGQ